MNNVHKLLDSGRFSVADDGFSARVLQAAQQAPVFVPRRISAWHSFYLPMIGAAVGMVFLCLLVSRVIDLDQVGAKWSARSEMMAQQFMGLDTLHIRTK